MGNQSGSQNKSSQPVRQGTTDGVAFRGTTAVHPASLESEPPVAIRYRKLQLHPELFDVQTGWLDEWFDPDFLEAFRKNNAEAYTDIITEVLPGEAFSCKMFSEKFCKLLIEEVEHFQASGLPARRPNSMNNYGIILNEIGWRPMVDSLQDHVMAVLAARRWPHIAPFDDHHTFIVRYKEGEDRGLDMHTDSSDVTFNLCLGKNFSGAGLSFCGVMGSPEHRKHRYTYQHEVGRCIWHLGRLRHGADDIQSGERLNLILWNQSSAYQRTAEYRNPPYKKEEGPPDAICLSYTHDRDYGVFKSYSTKNEDSQGRGWCPRRGYEYDGFKPEKEPSGGRRRSGG
jgi:hypothetical protein